MRVEIRALIKTFGTYPALHGVTLDVLEGEFCALLGPSGSGKTTLLRIIAGLEFPDGGEVRFAGENVVGRDARERQVGFVFQHYALFRHMSVFENVAFGLRVRPRRLRPPEVLIDARVMELLRLVQLDGLAVRYPNQLSGGQRQRVALARALAIEPRILLLDEPFGALDAKVRKELRRWLRELHERLGLTSVFVTHDQEEALELADRVVVMRAGRIEQVGSPRAIYDHPQTPFVYEFLGSANRLPCRVRDGWIELEGARWPAAAGHAAGEGEALLFVRPQDLAVARGFTDGIPARLEVGGDDRTRLPAGLPGRPRRARGRGRADQEPLRRAPPAPRRPGRAPAAGVRPVPRRRPRARNASPASRGAEPPARGGGLTRPARRVRRGPKMLARQVPVRARSGCAAPARAWRALRGEARGRGGHGDGHGDMVGWAASSGQGGLEGWKRVGVALRASMSATP